MILLLTALSFAVPSASAQEPQEDQIDRAKDLFNSGRILYEEGRYEEAIVAWDEAWRLSSEPVLLYNIANAHERLGDYDEAVEVLRQYAQSVDDSERDAINKRIKSLEKRRDELAAQSQPDEPTPTPTPTPEPTPTSTGSVERSGPPVLPLALVGVGAVGIGTGVAFGLGARSARAEADTLCVDGLCPAEAQSAIDLDRRNSALADIGFVVGGVGLATGGALLLFSGRSVSADIGDTGLTLTPSVSTGSVWLSGEF